MDTTWLESPHRRWNPLRREWVIVSPHRTQRPWQGQTEDVVRPSADTYDPACYLCPGNVRANGSVTPAYESTYVFDNDFAALHTDVVPTNLDVGDLGLLRATTERGVCRVVCFDSRHDLTLATMQPAQIRRVVDVWAAQSTELGARPEIGYVQIFENRGAMMGASNPHPHGQIWATEHIPNEPLAELSAQLAYFAANATNLLSAYLRLELDQLERIVAQNDSWVVLVPFWAVWPFETLILPREHVSRLEELDDKQRDGLADILGQLASTYNKVFQCPFPYSMGFHTAPSDGRDHPEWNLHAHFYPPLLRSATVRKFMVGFELLGSPQRDITPEYSASVLRRIMEAGLK